jgi:YD repeat-containing protein
VLFFRLPTVMLIQTAFTLQKDEFAKAHRLVLRNLPLKLRSIGWVQFGLLMALIILPPLYQPNDKLQPFCLLVSLVAWLVLLAGRITGQAQLTLQFKRMDGKEVRYEFDDTGFRSSMTDAESRLSWSAVSHLFETDDLLVLSIWNALLHDS